MQWLTYSEESPEGIAFIQVKIYVLVPTHRRSFVFDYGLSRHLIYDSRMVRVRTRFRARVRVELELGDESRYWMPRRVWVRFRIRKKS